MWDTPLVMKPPKAKATQAKKPKAAKPKAKPRAKSKAKPTVNVTKELNVLKALTKKQSSQIDELTALVRKLVDQQ